MYFNYEEESRYGFLFGMGPLAGAQMLIKMAEEGQNACICSGWRKTVNMEKIHLHAVTMKVLIGCRLNDKSSQCICKKLIGYKQ